ncbi:MAG: hypothetical protein HQ517_15110 [SAR324 cluster bacterium]|nr:hypothetical protein [SAR324 cluster bacterium]
MHQAITGILTWNILTHGLPHRYARVLWFPTLTFPDQITLMISILIQVGGLGIMTFSTLFLLLAGRRPRLAEQVLIRDTFTRGGDKSVRTIVKDICNYSPLLPNVPMKPGHW